jgi:hypothetical protein
MTNILKSWKTTTIAVVIIAGLAIYGYKNGFDIQSAISGLIALGFFVSKDADKTHSKQAITGDHPDPDKEEK